MTWKCSQFHEYECILSRSVPFGYETDVKTMAESLKRSTNADFDVGAWADLTIDYTRREMTYDIDTFPAIAGIVRIIQELNGDEYYAGLWKSHFLDGLLWHCHLRKVEYLPVERRGEKSRDLKKRRIWTAPSWSWVSVKGAIDYFYAEEGIPYHREQCARLEECKVTCSGLDPFGVITDGFARITGPVTPIIDVQTEDNASGLPPSCIIQLGDGTSATVSVVFDIDPHESCCALMIYTHVGLCIKQVEKTTDTFVRVGTIEVKTDWWMCKSYQRRSGNTRLTASDHCSPRTVTLI